MLQCATVHNCIRSMRGSITLMRYILLSYLSLKCCHSYSKSWKLPCLLSNAHAEISSCQLRVICKLVSRGIGIFIKLFRPTLKEILHLKMYLCHIPLNYITTDKLGVIMHTFFFTNLFFLVT